MGLKHIAFDAQPAVGAKPDEECPRRIIKKKQCANVNLKLNFQRLCQIREEEEKQQRQKALSANLAEIATIRTLTLADTIDRLANMRLKERGVWQQRHPSAPIMRRKSPLLPDPKPQNQEIQPAASHKDDVADNKNAHRGRRIRRASL
ncbi:hypothetical protein FJU08_15405 [Martelella alba]|uniref:Uncharacterized protein n=1 Tax=Martelella alba TaxID=2590451 RepID=A0A506U8D9_9HYPH|nr:hypothetical protein [Martelella alba]TPW29235.1 hypothetical protein FJU08_15405 [Martelella alba]